MGELTVGILDQLTDRIVATGQAIVSRVFADERAARQRDLEALERLYKGEQYSGKGLATSWDKVPPGQRAAPLRMQQPSVQYELPKLVVNRLAALLFGVGHFPDLAFEAEDEAQAEASAAVSKWLTQIADDGALARKCLTWGRQGCTSGSAVLVWDCVDGRFEFRPLRSSRCNPTFDPRRPDRLIELELRYKFNRRETALEAGVLRTRVVSYWHREVWDASAHTVFVDAPVGDGKEPVWSVLDRVEHGLGFVPAAWVKPIDDGEECSPDGCSVLEGMESITEDVDRTISQKSRALRYNLDPERIYYGWTLEQIQALRVGGDASTRMPKKSDGADVQVLELNGASQTIADEHVASQRARALEVARVVSPDTDKILAAAHSGAAIRLLYAPTLELLGELQQSFGAALRTVLEQILEAVRSGRLKGALARPAPAIPAGKCTLLWGDTFEATPADLQLIAATVSALYRERLLDRETCVRYLASYFGVRDVAAILARLDEEAEERAEKAPSFPPATTKPTTELPEKKQPEEGGEPNEEEEDE